MHSRDLRVLAEDDTDDEDVDNENEDCQTAQYADLHGLVMGRNICAVGRCIEAAVWGVDCWGEGVGRVDQPSRSVVVIGF